MFDVVDFNTGMVLKEQVPSRSAAIDWINRNFKPDHWSIKEETTDTICLDLIATRWPPPRRY